jgi:hypothetical protein
MPDAFWTFVLGVFGASALTLVGTFIGSALQNRRDHVRWVRENRLDAYRDFLAKAELTWPSQSKDLTVWRTYMDDIGTALVVVRLVGPDEVSTAGESHLNELLTLGGLQRKVNGVDDGVKHPELQGDYLASAQRMHGTRESFVIATRAALNILG